MSLLDLWISIVALVLFFLAARRVMLWYFRIDRAVDALEDIAASLRAMPAVRDADARSGRRPPRAA